MNERAFWLEIRRSLIQAAGARNQTEMRRALLRMVSTIERRYGLGQQPARQEQEKRAV